MKTRVTRKFFLTVAAAILCAGTALRAGVPPLSDSLRRAYDFKGAVAWCERMAEIVDSTRLGALEQELILSQNGLSMTRYCSRPEVVARYRFSLNDFFLFYPLENRAWRTVPNQLDSLAEEGLVRAMYVPQDATDIYYSARDAEGIRNLYHTSLRDSVWSVPQLINEDLTSSSDEIYPFVTPDGKTLYFASKGLYGMGGYDLYVSQWNENTRDWDAPVNLGFPYSSPYDDFLLAPSEDGQYTVFASNRGCPRDSVWVYILAFDSMPVRTEIGTVDALKALCSLTPEEDRHESAGHAIQGIPEDENTRRYVAAMDRVRLIRDSISRFNAGLERLRNQLKEETDAARLAQVREEILSCEIALPAHQKRLTAALKELQQIEMDFLSNGIVIDPDKLRAEADREMVGTPSHYVFSKNEPGPALDLDIEKPEPSFDYSFKILDVGQFAEDNTLPDGLVYQIQMFASARKATERELKGLSPVFARAASGGKTAYSVGVFRSYADALSHLNKVKNRGFKGAVIVAFQDGKMIAVPAARKLETASPSLFKVRIWPEDGATLSDAALEAIHACTDKDIIRAKEGVATVYEVGPFSDRADCSLLVTALKEAGVDNVTVSSADGK
jgi:hypothetical protein